MPNHAGPILRALTDSGETWDDPSEGLLFEILGDVERCEDDCWLLVERLSEVPGWQESMNWRRFTL